MGHETIGHRVTVYMSANMWREGASGGGCSGDSETGQGKAIVRNRAFLKPGLLATGTLSSLHIKQTVQNKIKHVPN